MLGAGSWPPAAIGGTPDAAGGPAPLCQACSEPLETVRTEGSREKAIGPRGGNGVSSGVCRSAPGGTVVAVDTGGSEAPREPLGAGPRA